VSASCPAPSGATAVDRSIGSSRSRVVDTTNSAAISTRNAIARPSRSPVIVVAMIQT
jgi:hypothetical protein